MRRYRAMARGGTRRESETKSGQLFWKRPLVSVEAVNVAVLMSMVYMAAKGSPVIRFCRLS